MTRADRENAVSRKTRSKFQQPLAGRSSARNYEALSKTRISYFRSYFEFRSKILTVYSQCIVLSGKTTNKIFDLFNPSYQPTTLIVPSSRSPEKLFKNFEVKCRYWTYPLKSVSFWQYTTKFILAPSFGNLPYLLNDPRNGKSNGTFLCLLIFSNF